MELKWAQLMPPAHRRSSPLKPKTFFVAARPVRDDGSPPPPPLPEGNWMSAQAQAGAASDLPPQVVTELDGKRVRIGGYVVPLDFEATTVKEFLLVPFVGACIHVPPPPANQIIYVKAEKGFEVAGHVRSGDRDGHDQDRDRLHRPRRRRLQHRRREGRAAQAVRRWRHAIFACRLAWFKRPERRRLGPGATRDRSSRDEGDYGFEGSF